MAVFKAEKADDMKQVTDSQNVMKVMKDRDMKQVSSRQKAVKIAVKIALYAFLITMGIIVLFPFYWMIISSLKTMSE